MRPHWLNFAHSPGPGRSYSDPIRSMKTKTKILIGAGLIALLLGLTATALVVQDLYVHLRGGKSMTGAVLGPQKQPAADPMDEARRAAERLVARELQALADSAPVLDRAKYKPSPPDRVEILGSVAHVQDQDDRNDEMLGRVGTPGWADFPVIVTVEVRFALRRGVVIVGCRPDRKPGFWQVAVLDNTVLQ